MPNPPIEKPVVTPKKIVETMGEAHPPILALSDTTVPAVSASHTGATEGMAVSAKSNTGHGVFGQTSGPQGYGVYGVHAAGGSGVYGKSSGNAGFFEGNVTITQNLTVGGDVLLPGADFAEQFDLSGSCELEPGTLVVIADGASVAACRTPYDRKVVGVIAGAGAYRPGIILDSGESGPERTRVSLVGKVYCKADARYGAIGIGDLLTSSPTEGHAMKAADTSRAFGAVVGKALGGLEKGKGLIPIVIALQ